MLRKVSKAAAAAPPEGQREEAHPPPPILAEQSRASCQKQQQQQQQRHQVNREMPWVDHDYVSSVPAPSAAAAAAAALTPRFSAVLPEFLRQEGETLPFKHKGLLSTMRYLDFSDVRAPEAAAPDFTGPDDLGSLIDNTNDIDWVSWLSVYFSTSMDYGLMTLPDAEHGGFVSAGPR